MTNLNRTTETLFGSGVPAASLGRDGDTYIRTNGGIYKKAAGAWTLQVSFTPA